MTQRWRGKGEIIPEVPALLIAMGEMRKRLIATAGAVRPFGAAFHALHMVVRSIDALATFATGQRDYYSAGFRPPSLEE